jgi:predicted  nucleic acid-binding Zn-ribbon protein
MFHCRFCCADLETDQEHLFQCCPFCGTNIRFEHKEPPPKVVTSVRVKEEQQELPYKELD